MSTTPSKPKPATGADAHRQDDEDSDDVEHAAIPEDISPADRDGGGGGGGDRPDAGAGGGAASVFGQRKVVIGLALVAGALLVYWYLNSQNVQRQPDRDDASAGGDVEPEENGMPNIPNNPDDPLAADHEAMKYIFGGRPETEMDGSLDTTQRAE